MKPSLIIFIIYLSFFLISCSTSTKVTHSTHHLSKSDKRFLEIDTTPGQRDIQIDFLGDSPWHLRAVFPPADKYPKILVIALQWAGGGDNYKDFSDCLVQPAFAQKNAILLVPDAENEVWYSPKNEKRLVKLIRLAQKNWSITPEHTIIMGYSNGGNGAWYYAEKYPHLFHAAIPMASAYKPSGRKISLPMYVIHGANDELFDINQTRVWVESAQANNDKIVFKRVASLSHYEACRYLPALKQAVDWLDKVL